MTPIRPLLRALPLLVLLAGCQHDNLKQTEASLDAANQRAGHAFGPEISAEDFAAHLKVLASDDFAGRMPGSEGETKTVEYLRTVRGADELKAANAGDRTNVMFVVPRYAVTSDFERLTITTGLEEMALSPDGKKVAFVAHGEVFAASARDGGTATRVSDSPALSRPRRRTIGVFICSPLSVPDGMQV